MIDVELPDGADAIAGPPGTLFLVADGAQPALLEVTCSPALAR